MYIVMQRIVKIIYVGVERRKGAHSMKDECCKKCANRSTSWSTGDSRSLELLNWIQAHLCNMFLHEQLFLRDGNWQFFHDMRVQRGPIFSPSCLVSSEQSCYSLFAASLFFEHCLESWWVSGKLENILKRVMWMICSFLPKNKRVISVFYHWLYHQIPCSSCFLS